MKDNRTVNEPVPTEPAEAEEKRAVTDLGKFRDVRALLEAYQALEAEFTRRSQRLKELEASKEQGASAKCEQAEPEETKQTGGVLPEEKKLPGTALTEGEGGTQAAANAQAPSTGATACNGGAVNGVALSGISEHIKNAVIEEYLNDVLAKRQVPFVTGGGPVTAERRTPKNMREAGALAKRLFKNKEEN